MQGTLGEPRRSSRPVLSASTVRECYDLTIKSFNFSEKFRTPVVLLIDEVVAHMRKKMVFSEEEECRDVSID